jgi:predicted DNA-binding transcriptional regulator YafY
MRASRLISVLLLLQTRGRMTAQQLASELEVSVRTVYRDVEELSASGIPVFADRGTHGGFQLVEGYRTRLTGLTPEEAEALFLSGYPGPAAELGLGTVLAAAQLKVLAALPPELRGRASRLRQRFHLDAPGWFHTPESTPHLQQIADAVWSDRRLQMRYRRGDDVVVDRTVDPMGVVLKAGVWYMVARSGGDMRTYRISRIVALVPSHDRFERPDEFDLAGYWERSVAAYADSLPSFEAQVRVKESSAWRMADTLGPGRAREAFESSTGPDEKGWRTMTITLEEVDRAVGQLLAFGGEIQVISPEELREGLVGAARRILGLYEDGRNPTGPTGPTSSPGPSAG